MRATGKVQSNVERHGRRPAVVGLGRLGYAAKAVLYFVIGLLALRLAMGNGGANTDTKGAVHYLAGLPFGTVLLVVLCVGLLGLVAWRAVQLFVESPKQKTPAKRWMHRGGVIASAVAHTALLAATVRLLTSGRSGGSSNATRDWTARLMDAPFGQALVAVAGVIVLGFGAREVWKAYKRSFEKKLMLDGVAAKQSHRLTRICQFGVAARGAVFAIMGLFLLQAAIRHDPSEARGIGQTLSTIAEGPFGMILLGLVAAGLIAYAVYALVEARYRRMPAT